VHVIESFNFYQVKPDTLDFEPLVHDFLQEQEPGLPLADLLLEGLDVGRAAHRLSLDDVVIQQNLPQQAVVSSKQVLTMNKMIEF
jgi:hypothetical protein